MFGFGRGRGRGRSRGRGFGPGVGYGFGRGRGICLDYYQAHGQWPAWSRMAGGPGYWRSGVTEMPASAEYPANEVSELRAEVAELREQIELALSKLSTAN